MSLSRRIALNTVLQVAARSLGIIFGIVAFGMMTRYLGQSGFGAFTTITSFLLFFGFLADLGLYVVTIQMLSEENSNTQKNFSNLLAYRVVTSSCIIALAPLVALFFPYPDHIKWGIALTASSYWFSSMIQFFTALFQTHIRMEVPSIADILSKVVMIGVLLAVLFYDWGLSGVLWSLILNNAVQCVILFFASLRYVRFSFRFDRDVWKEIVRRSWPIALSIILNIIYLKADTIILSLYKSQADVGLYGAAYRIIEVLIALPFLFIGLTLSSFARSWSQRDMPSFKRYYQKSFDFLVMCALPLIVGAYFLGTRGMTIISGEGFEQSGDILKILVIAAALVFLSALYGNLINIIGKQRVMVWGYLASALIGVAGYFSYIPMYGTRAAAWITVLTECIILIVASSIVTRTTRLIPSFANVGKVALSCAVMGAALFATKNLPFAVQLSAGIASYALLLYISRAVPKDTIISLFSKNTRQNT